MTITHTTPDEMIKLQQTRIDALSAEVVRLRSDNHTLAALNLKLSTTDLTAAEVAQSLIAGCPQWQQVAAELLLHIVGTERHVTAKPAPLIDPALLTRNERKLFDMLAAHMGSIVSSDTLILTVWPNSALDRRARNKLWVLLSRVRRVLDAHAPTLKIRTASGVGLQMMMVAEQQTGKKDK